MANVGSIVFSVVGCLIASVVIAAIVLFIRNATCPKTSINSYEHFEDSYASALNARIKNVQNAINNIQGDLDTYGDSADETCDIMKNVEATFISSKSAPSDESEYSLPRETQNFNFERRKKYAAKRFKSEISDFETSKEHKLLECFTDSQDTGALEDNLRSGIDTLTKLIDSSELKIAVDKGSQIWYTLLFTAPHLKKAVNVTTVESFGETLLTGGDLLSKADELVGKANTLHQQFAALMDQVKKQKQINSTLTKKAGDLQNGKASDTDVQSVKASGDMPTYSPP